MNPQKLVEITSAMSGQEMMKFIIFWVVMPLVVGLAIAVLAHFHKGFGAHLKGMFNDNVGKPSFTRMASFIALMAVIFWVTHIVWKTLTIPELWDPVMFIGAMFFLDRLPEIIMAWKGARPPVAPAQGTTSPPTT